MLPGQCCYITEGAVILSMEKCWIPEQTEKNEGLGEKK